MSERKNETLKDILYEIGMSQRFLRKKLIESGIFISSVQMHRISNGVNDLKKPGSVDIISEITGVDKERIKSSLSLNKKRKNGTKPRPSGAS